MNLDKEVKPLSPRVPERVSGGIFTRISLMMLLQYMTYGAWWTVIGLVLSSRGMENIVGLTFALAALAAVLSPGLVGAIADRFVSAQKIMAIIHAVGGVLLLVLPQVIEARNSNLFLALIFVYMLLFQPTMSLTNSITFVHVPEGSNMFAYVRACGTLAFIIMGVLIGQSGLSAGSSVFYIAGPLSLVLAAYSLTLPATPPPQTNARFNWGDLIGLGGFRLFRKPNFVVLVICVGLTEVPIAIWNAYASTYFNAAGIPNIASVLTVGLVTELILLLALPTILRRLSFKWVMLTGLASWVIRAGFFLVMTHGRIDIALVIIAFQGVCNDFFVMTGSMYVDAIAPREERAQGQSL